MKRMAYVLLVGIFFFLTACSSQTQPQSQTDTAQTTQSETETTASSPSMNIEEIVAGNYASVAGVWVSASGEKLVFNNTGLATSIYQPEAATLTYFGTADMLVVGSDNLRQTFLLELIPAGVTIPDQLDYAGNVLFQDTSDSSRDRLWTGSGSYPYQEAGNFFYRVE